jgi:hypothetical protein
MMMRNTNNKIVYDKESLKKDLRHKRVIELDLNILDCCNQIGISTATLSRIENGKTPDIITFFSIVKWLNAEPTDYIIYLD